VLIVCACAAVSTAAIAFAANAPLPLTFGAALLGVLAGASVARPLAGEWAATAENPWPNVSTPPCGARAWMILGALGVLVLASTAYGRIDAVLHAFHRSGDATFGADALTGVVRNPWQGALQIGEAVRTWQLDDVARRAESAGVALRDPRALVNGMFGVDSLLLVPSYVFLLVLLVGAARRLLQRERDEIILTTSNELLRTFFRFHRWAAGGVVLAACADWLENGLATLTVAMAWRATPEDAAAATTAFCYGTCQVLAVLLGFCTTAKWLGLVLSVVYVLLVGLVALQHGGDGERTWFRLPRLRAGLLRLALPVGIVVALALLLLANPQAPDVLRRWSRADQQLGVIVTGVLATFVLAIAIALSTVWLLLEPQKRVDADPRLAAAHTLPGMTTTGWWFTGTAVLLYALGWAAAAATVSRLPLLVVLGAPLAVGALGLWLAHLPQRIRFGNPPAAIALSIFGIAVVCLEWGITGAWQVVLPLVLVGALLGGGALLREWPETDPEPFPTLARVPSILAAAVPLVVGIALLSAGLDVAVYQLWRNELRPDAAVLLAVGLFLALGAPLLVDLGVDRLIRGVSGWFRLGDARSRAVGASAALFIGGVTIWSSTIAVLAHDDAAIFAVEKVGLLTMLCLVLVLVAAVATGLVALVEEAFPVPAPIFRMFGATRTGVMPIIGIWFVLGALLSLPEAAHDVRLIPTKPDAPPRAQPPTIADRFNDWQGELCLPSNTIVPADPGRVRSRPVHPLILVATAGGGIRAAVWTTYVLDREFGYGPYAPCSGAPPASPRRSSWVFAMSGVSGGSVGLATYSARQAAADAARAQKTPPSPWTETPDAQNNWIRANYGGDGLTPTLTWLLLVESQWSLMHYPLDRDRAAVLEGVFERWAADPTESANADPPTLFDAQRRTQIPLLLLNGTSVESGCRFNGSIVRTVGRSTSDVPPLPLSCVTPIDLRGVKEGNLGATVDLVDFVCDGYDIRLATVALLSARFPYISPSGGMQQCTRKDDAPRLRTFVVDGGYHEGSGMVTMLDVWSTLAPIVADYNARADSPVTLVPMLLQIDNGYDEPVGPGATPVQPQLFVPPATYLATPGAIEARGRQAGQIAFQQDYRIAAGLRFCGPRYAHYALRAHPGPSAPLGWVLSDVSFDDFAQQLTALTSTKGETPGQIVNHWFDATWMMNQLSSDCSAGYT